MVKKKKESILTSLFKHSKNNGVEVVAQIKKMDCKQAKDDKSVLICDITAKSGSEEIKEKIAMQVPKLKFMKVEDEKSKKPKYYFKEIEVEE